MTKKSRGFFYTEKDSEITRWNQPYEEKWKKLFGRENTKHQDLRGGNVLEIVIWEGVMQKLLFLLL